MYHPDAHIDIIFPQFAPLESLIRVLVGPRACAPPETRAIGRQKTQSFPVSRCISGREMLMISDSPSHVMLLFQVY